MEFLLGDEWPVYILVFRLQRDYLNIPFLQRSIKMAESSGRKNSTRNGLTIEAISNLSMSTVNVSLFVK